LRSEEAQPGTLDKLSLLKQRTKRIVARTPKHLFERDHLTEKCSDQLIDGWWYGTNNSARETKEWLKRACSCSGLNWQDNFKTSL
jgi:hypothetical protein